jgi:hypothetical protein
MAWTFLIFGIVLIASGIIFLMFFYQKDNTETIDRIQNLNKQKYDPNMTRFAARKEAKAAVPRTELLTLLNQETSLLTQTIEQEAAALQANYRKEDSLTTYSLEREKQLADHESYLALADNQTTVARIASQMGLDPSTMKELILEKARMETQLAFRQREMELEVEKHRLMKQVDFEFENKMAGLDTNMAEIEHLLPQHLINALHKQLSSIHFEYEQVKLLDDGEFKQREIKRVERNMKALEKNIREREKNL